MEKLRQKIDQIDQQLLKLLQQRKELVLQIAELKKDSQLPLKQPEREKIVLEKIAQLSAKLGLDQKFTQDLFKLIIKNSLQQQKLL
ncbi:MAG: chorismate mutase [Nanoarchaeota archaeon]|nr:chorismate mutase [Nanoarchaeota archaeon]MBU1622568.1 chorismate mutase [Nanoarchaeota archaeon]MBU1973940.1 chorismate mutase [Nanoarchaeota archaeon]